MILIVNVLSSVICSRFIWLADFLQHSERQNIGTVHDLRHLVIPFQLPTLIMTTTSFNERNSLCPQFIGDDHDPSPTF